MCEWVYKNFSSGNINKCVNVEGKFFMRYRIFVKNCRYVMIIGREEK